MIDKNTIDKIIEEKVRETLEDIDILAFNGIDELIYKATEEEINKYFSTKKKDIHTIVKKSLETYIGDVITEVTEEILEG
jgi:hypothetical protein